MRALPAVLIATLMLSAAASAGPLRSATLRIEFFGAPITIDASQATGSLNGSHFTLDAGSAFAGAECAGTSLACGGLALPRPVAELSVTLGGNGALSGELTAATFAAPLGITGRLRVKAKIGKAPAFTLLAIGTHRTVPWLRLGEPTTCAFGTSAFSGCVPGATGSIRIQNDGWHLGPIAQTGLTLGGDAHPDARATGSVAQTPGGGTRINLVSLSRISQTDHQGFAPLRLALFAQLTLLFVPEPSGVALIAAAGVALAAHSRMRRPEFRRPH